MFKLRETCEFIQGNGVFEAPVSNFQGKISQTLREEVDINKTYINCFFNISVR